jgi:hypothetical protein
MAPGRWPTIDEVVERARQGIIDESYMTIRPDHGALEVMRADVEQFHAKRRAAGEQPQRPARRRKPA